MTRLHNDYLYDEDDCHLCDTDCTTRLWMTSSNMEMKKTSCKLVMTRLHNDYKNDEEWLEDRATLVRKLTGQWPWQIRGTEVLQIFKKIQKVWLELSFERRRISDELTRGSDDGWRLETSLECLDQFFGMGLTRWLADFFFFFFFFVKIRKIIKVTKFYLSGWGAVAVVVAIYNASLALSCLSRRGSPFQLCSSSFQTSATEAAAEIESAATRQIFHLLVRPTARARSKFFPTGDRRASPRSDGSAGWPIGCAARFCGKVFLPQIWFLKRGRAFFRRQWKMNFEVTIFSRKSKAAFTLATRQVDEMTQH
jgi:hypothetical protein